MNNTAKSISLVDKYRSGPQKGWKAQAMCRFPRTEQYHQAQRVSYSKN